jgi:hypothetical protein
MNRKIATLRHSHCTHVEAEMCSVDGAIQSVLAAQQGALQSQISAAVAAKQVDAVEQQGEAVNAMLEAAAELSKSLTSGKQFDALA